MSQSTFETTDTLPQARTKLNANFDEIYGRVGPALFTASKVIYVSKDGTATDTRTGLNKYDLFRPFATLGAAKTAAASGDLIYVLPGAYTVTDTILKDGVNWHFEVGTTVTQTPANTDTTGFLNDTTGLTSKITGHGLFILDCTGRVGAVEQATITLTNVFAGDYITVYKIDGSNYNFWFSVNGSGSAPGIGGTSVEVALLEFFSSADASAALVTAMNGPSIDYSVTDNVGSVTAVGVATGARTDITSSDSGHITITIDQQGYLFQLISLVKTIASSSLYIEGEKFKVILPATDNPGNDDTYPTVIETVDGSLTLRGDIIGEGSFVHGIWWKNGFCDIRSSEIRAGAYVVWSTVTATPTGDLYITAEIIEGRSTNAASATCCIYTTGTQATAAAWITAKVIKNNNTAANPYYCYYSLGAEKIYVTAQKLFGNLSTTGTGEAYIEAQKLAPIVNGMTLLSYGNTADVYLRIDRIDIGSFTSIALGDLTGTGSNLFTIGECVGNSSTTGLNVSNSIFLRDSRIDLTAGTNKTAITATAGVPTLINCILIGTGTGYDINETGAGSVNVAGGYGSGTSGHFRTAGTINILTPA